MRNGRGEVLLLERHVSRAEGLRHEIRLPKGHIEPGETAAEAALREVCEESGYCGLAILAALAPQEVKFVSHGGVATTRCEFYFLMCLTEEQRRTPQPDPGSEENRFQPRWVATFEEAYALLTYPTEQRIVQRAADG